MSKSKNQSGSSATSSIDFMNIKDIDKGKILTKDNYYIAFIKLKGLDTDLLSDNEKERKIRFLSADLSRINSEFSLFSISRPFNMDKLREQFEEHMRFGNDIQRQILKIGMNQINEFVEKGEATERLMYIKLFDKSKEELDKRLQQIKECFTNNNIGAEIIDDADIARLINLFNNPNTFLNDSIDNDISLPIVSVSDSSSTKDSEPLAESPDINNNQGE